MDIDVDRDLDGGKNEDIKLISWLTVSLLSGYLDSCRRLRGIDPKRGRSSRAISSTSSYVPLTERNGMFIFGFRILLSSLNGECLTVETIDLADFEP